MLIETSVDANKELLGQVIERFAHHPSLSYIDCYLAEEALTSGNVPLLTFYVPLLTFDQKLAKQHPAAQMVAGTARGTSHA